MVVAIVGAPKLEIVEDACQELVDAIVAAVDTGRSDEVARLQAALEPFGLAETLRDELWLSGLSSDDGFRCWCREVE